MLFHVTMTVAMPPDLDPAVAADLKGRERAMALELQARGKWRHLWRVAGRYANVSIFDVADPQELHDILTALPLYPYMTIEVQALCRHPSSAREDDR